MRDLERAEDPSRSQSFGRRKALRFAQGDSGRRAQGSYGDIVGDYLNRVAHRAQRSAQPPCLLPDCPGERLAPACRTALAPGFAPACSSAFPPAFRPGSTPALVPVSTPGFGPVLAPAPTGALTPASAPALPEALPGAHPGASPPPWGVFCRKYTGLCATRVGGVSPFPAIYTIWYNWGRRATCRIPEHQSGFSVAPRRHPYVRAISIVRYASCMMESLVSSHQRPSAVQVPTRDFFSLNPCSSSCFSVHPWFRSSESGIRYRPGSGYS